VKKKTENKQKDKDALRRFLLFIVEENPQGGLADMHRDFDILEAAIVIAKSRLSAKPYIFDCDQRKVVWRYEDK